MRMEIHQIRVSRKVVIHGVNTEMGISNGRARHVQRINNLLKVRGGAIRWDLIGENGEEIWWGKKSKTHWIFNQKNWQITWWMIRSHDNKQMIGNRSKNDHRTTNRKPIIRMIIEQLIGNRSKNDHGTTDQKPIMGTIIERSIRNESQQTEPRSSLDYKEKDN